MRSGEHVAQARRARRKRRAVQLATCVSVLVLSCSVYDPSLLSRDGADALHSDEAGAGSGSLGASGAPEMGQGGHLAQAGEQNASAGADASGGAAGAVEPELGGGGGGVIVTSGGAGSTSGGNGGAANGGSPSAGSAAANSAGTAGSSGLVIELAKGKIATASTSQPANDASKGNDGDSATRWCATTAAMPQWWRVDLGDPHQLTQVVLKFEHPERTYSYVIETSLDDATYTEQATINKGTGDTQLVALPANASGRYLRVRVTVGDPYTDSTGKVNPTWASFWELRAYGY